MSWEMMCKLICEMRWQAGPVALRERRPDSSRILVEKFAIQLLLVGIIHIHSRIQMNVQRNWRISTRAVKVSRTGFRYFHANISLWRSRGRWQWCMNVGKCCRTVARTSRDASDFWFGLSVGKVLQNPHLLFTSWLRSNWWNILSRLLRVNAGTVTMIFLSIILQGDYKI